MLTAENYFSPENSMRYMGVSQFKTFLECESRGLAEARHEWTREMTPSMMVGSYIDAHFSKELPLFEAQHPEIFLKGGGLKSEFRNALEIIARIEREPFLMKYLNGEPQRIMTGEIAGVEFKIKIDMYHANKVNVDLKIMRDFEDIWKDGIGKMRFAEYWGYDTQGAVYTEIERQNRGVNAAPLPFILICASKQSPPGVSRPRDVPQDVMDEKLEIVKSLAPRFAAIKRGEIIPTRCEKCDWCRETMVIDRVIDYREVGY